MSFYRKGLVIVSLGVFCLGAGLFLSKEAPFDAPPRIASHTLAAKKEILSPFPSAAVLAAPWFVAPPPVPAVAKPAPQPVKTPDPVDKKSVAFLGSYKDKDGLSTYFFKFLPSGSVMILKPGQANKGWELVDIQDHLFALTGPGGRFEVSH